MKLMIALISIWSAAAFASEPCCELPIPNGGPHVHADVVITAADCETGQIAWREGESASIGKIEKDLCRQLRRDHAGALRCTAVRADIELVKKLSPMHPFGSYTVLGVSNVRDIQGACL